MAQLTGLIGRATAGTGMTAKGAALTWGEEDNNFLLLLNFANLLGAAFNNDGTINIPAPASTQIVSALLPFMGPVGAVSWMPCEMTLGVQTPAQNGSVWVEANGQALSPTDYPQLYALFGTKYNQAGDNPATTFRVPDLKRRFLYGRGAAGQEIAGIPPAAPATGNGFGGEETHPLAGAEQGTFNASVSMTGITGGAGSAMAAISLEGQVLGTGATGPDTIGLGAAATAHNNLPPYALGVFYIRAGYKLSGAMVPA